LSFGKKLKKSHTKYPKCLKCIDINTPIKITDFKFDDKNIQLLTKEIHELTMDMARRSSHYHGYMIYNEEPKPKHQPFIFR
jgi:hypothetical protein